MNYAGFALPMWHWLRGFRQRAHGIDPDPSGPPGWPTLALLDAWQARRAAVPWAVMMRQYNLLGSHDVPRIRSVVSGNASLHKLAAAVQFTYPGLPSIYYGDEIGMEDLPLLGERGCMVFDEARWDRSTFAHYQRLVALRRASEPLRAGGFEVLPAEPDTLFYQREGVEGRVLVVAHRGEAPRPEGPVRVREAGVPDGLELTDAH